MKIRSIFKDYYDAGIAYGIDEELLYIREQFPLYSYLPQYKIDSLSYNLSKEKVKKIVDFRNYVEENSIKKVFNNLGHLDINHIDNIEYKLTYNVVYVAGENIPFVRCQKVKNGFGYTSSEVLEELFFYDNELYLNFIEKLIIKSKNFREDNTRTINIAKDKFRKHIENYENDKSLDFIYSMFDTPIFLLAGYGDSEILINPILKDIKYKDHIDPYTCFQDISMFLGYLKNKEEENPNSSIDDISLRDGKGFDKMSFKRRPKS